MLDKLGIKTGTISIGEIIAIAIFGISSLVAVGLATITLFDYNFGAEFWAFTMPLIGNTVSFDYAVVFGTVAIAFIWLKQGFNRNCYRGLSWPERIVLVLGLSFFFLPPFFPQIEALITYNEWMRVFTFLLTTGSVYVLSRTNY